MNYTSFYNNKLKIQTEKNIEKIKENATSIINGEVNKGLVGLIL